MKLRIKGEDFIIKSIIHSNNIYTFNNLSKDTLIRTNNSFILPITFTPIEPKDYSDTFKFIRQFYTCIDTITSIVTGSGVSGPKTYFDFDSLFVKPNLTDLSVPVYAKMDYLASTEIMPDTIYATIRFDNDVFYPLSVSNHGKINSQKVLGGEKIIDIQVPNVKINKDRGIAFSIIGATLLENKYETTIKFDTLYVKDKSFYNAILDSGKIVLDICREGGDRFVIKAPANLMILKNQDDYLINARAGEIGLSKLSLYDIDGAEYVLSQKNIASLSEEMNYNLATKDYPSGVYLAVLATPNNRIIKKIFILK